MHIECYVTFILKQIISKETRRKEWQELLNKSIKSLLKCLLRLFLQAHYDLCKENLSQLEKHLLS